MTDEPKATPPVDAVDDIPAASLMLARDDPSHFLRLAGRDDRGEIIEQGDIHRLIQYHISYAWDRDLHAVIAGPPEHGKSVQVLYRLIWELGRSTSLRMAVISGNEQLARDRIQAVRSIVIDNQTVRAVFPELRPAEADQKSRREWRMSRFFVAREGEAVDPSVQAAAVMGRSEGKRVDILWCDDIVTREDWLSEAQREKTCNAWFSTWSKRLGVEGRAVFTNNCWHRKDLIHRLRDKAGYATLWLGIPDSCDRIVCEALNVGDDYLWQPGGGRFDIPLWTFTDEDGETGGWTQAELTKRLDEDAMSFRRLFGGRAVDISSMTFRPVEQWPTYRNLVDIPSWGSALIATFCDPAMGKGAGDYTAIVTVALGGDGRFYLVDAVLDQNLPPADACRKMFEIQSWVASLPGRGGHGLYAAGVETNCFQALMLTIANTIRDEFRVARNRGQDLPLRAVEVTGKKELRILGLEPDIAHGWIVVPEDASRRWPQLFEQFDGFGPESVPEHDDGPDAMASCVRLLRAGAALPSSEDVRDDPERHRPTTRLRGF